MPMRFLSCNCLESVSIVFSEELCFHLSFCSFYDFRFGYAFLTIYGCVKTDKQSGCLIRFNIKKNMLLFCLQIDYAARSLVKYII